MQSGFATVAGVVACLFLSSAAIDAAADVIDPFTASQGPITVGPGEEPSEEEAVVESGSVLGGFRVAAPGVEDDAQAGSTATLEVSGGTLSCEIDFPGSDPENNYGGCVTGYDRGDGPVFDLTGSSQFVIDVQSVDGGFDLGVTVVDANENISVWLVQGVSAGQVTIPFAALLPVNFTPTDLALVDNIGFAVVNQEGQEGRVVLSQISTDGAIGDGPVLPVDDDIAAEDIPGTYYNPDRDGEGCQLTRERDEETFILTCYFYKDGEQFWLIGVGQLVAGQIVFSELTITSGAEYGDGFDPDDVVRSNWGSAEMTWSDCNHADLALTPILPGYEVIVLTLTRIVPAICGSGGYQGEALAWTGALFDPARDGEGFHLGIEVNGVFVMTWYTYLGGKQVWLIGTGLRDGQQIVFDNFVVTYGADFGSQFNAADVVKDPFGTIVLGATDCNNFTATVDSSLPAFPDLVLNVTKIVPGACP